MALGTLDARGKSAYGDARMVLVTLCTAWVLISFVSLF